MAAYTFMILLSISYVVFPCEGKIISPPRGMNFTFLPGSSVNITWQFDDNISDVGSRTWSFTSSDGSGKVTLAVIALNGPPTLTKNLPRFDVIKPGKLVLKQVDKNYDGTYNFELKVDRKMDDTSDVRIFIAMTPIVTVNCSSPTTLNQSDNFTCECKGTDGNPPANVTWYKDNRTIVTGKEQAMLLLRNVDKDDNGTYRCEAKSHEKANNETTIEFIVNYPPEITSFDYNYKTRTLTCEAEAQPSPPIQIFFNGTDLIANGSTYTTIPEVNSSYVGNYTCVAENILGGDMLFTSILPIETAIITVNCSSPSKVKEGQYFACKCKGTNGNPPADVTWYKDNQTIVTGIEEAILRYPVAKLANNGTYICEAKSLEEAKNETSIELIVTVTPIITVNCSSRSVVNEGQYFACECKGTYGNPPAVVTWYKDNTQMVTGKEKAILRLTNVTRNNGGTYRCEATSEEKAKNITEIKLIVIVKPIIALSCADTVKLDEGEDFTCECNGTDENPPANVTWYKDGRAITTGKKHARLVLKNLQEEDSGTYKCVATSGDNAKNVKSIEVDVKVPDSCDVICIVAIIIGTFVIISLAICYCISRKNPLDNKCFIAILLIDVLVSVAIIAAGSYCLSKESNSTCVICIIAIIIGALDLIFAIAVYFCIKSRNRNKCNRTSNVNPGVENQYELGENEESPAGDKSSTTPNNAPEHTDASNNQKEVKSVHALVGDAAPTSNDSKEQGEDLPQPSEDANIDAADTNQQP